jgi:hypothetical protein
MSSTDAARDGGAALEDLTQRLAALEDAPVAEHPDVLDAVHTALVAELDSLAGVWRTPSSDRPRRAD